jgi:homocysteine S-methyltransferase
VKDFLEELGTRVILADAPLPSQASEFAEALCLSDPERVIAWHTACLQAGAEILRTNTCLASRRRLTEHGLESRLNELHWQASQLAKTAARGSGALVAGCVDGDDASAAETQERIGALLDGGANLVLLENFSNLADLVQALQIKHALHHCPVLCTLAWHPGLNIAQAFKTLAGEGADVVGLCGAGSEFVEVIQSLSHPDLAVVVSGVSESGFASLAEAPVGVLIGGGGISSSHLVAATSRLQAERQAQQG